MHAELRHPLVAHRRMTRAEETQIGAGERGGGERGGSGKGRDFGAGSQQPYTDAIMQFNHRFFAAT